MATETHKEIRVLIVDDSAFMRKVLETILITDENVHVVGHAKDGREAVRLAESLKPDVITMDINMPVMDGLQATAEIMTTNPRPIVVVSSESRQGAASTLRALELGAIEFVAKPSSGIDLDMHSVREDLLRKVRVAAKVRVVRTASRLVSEIKKSDGAPMPSLPPINTRAASSTDSRPTFSSCCAGRFHRRAGDGDAPGARLYARFPGGRHSRAAHACGIHDPVRRPAWRNLQASA